MTYEYLCTACGHAWEAEQSISAAPLKTCPSCQKETAKRQVSGGAGFILKGGGWYADLYGSAPAKSGSEAKEAKGDASKGESGKSDTATTTKSTDGGSSGSSGSSSGDSSGSSSGSKATGTTPSA